MNKDKKIITITNSYDVNECLTGIVIESNSLDSLIEFDNGETCWINNSTFTELSI